MSEQQDVDSGRYIDIDMMREKEPTHLSKDTVKIHRVKRHRKREQKFPSSHAVHDTPQTVDVDTKDTTSNGHTTHDTHISAKESDDTKRASSTLVATETVGATPVLPSLEEVLTAETIPDTPLPSSLEEDATPVLEVQKRHRSSRRTLLAYALIALLLISTVLLWQDLTATHLYVNTIDANNGSVRAQQDLGGYRDAIRLTAPLSDNNDAPVLLGVYAHDVGATQQLLTLHATTSTLSLQHSVTLVNGAITHAANGRLLVESANGLHVVTQDGQVAWQTQGEQPTHGVHHFQPVSDTEAVYSIKSVTQSQVAAYNLSNGHIRWTQTLRDIFEYAPPFLLDGEMLYVASDHNVFALNTSDGTVRWEKPYASRTLLLEREGQNHLLVALGAQGIQALQSDTGEVVWSFRGNAGVSELPTQFYQGSIGSIQGTNHRVIYATGVVWQMPSVREYVWLYAIDAATGEMHWSQQVASGSIGVDAGRELQPLLDADKGIVVLQRAGSRDERDVTAYDANTGTQRWNTHIADVHASSPIVFQISKNTFALFATTTDSQTILLTPSPGRTYMLLLLLSSIVGLLLLLFLPRTQGKLRLQRFARFVRVLFIPLRRRWNYVHTLAALALLALCIGAGIVAYTHINQPVRQLLTADKQGSIVVTTTDNAMHQLEALNANGTRQWNLFSSEGVFSLPTAQTQAGTLLVALHGDTTHTYTVAEDDPAYPRPLDHMLALYLLDRTTGRTLWQQIVAYPDEQQDAEVIGIDVTYIYIAGEHALAPATQERAGTQNIQTPQLFAVNRVTGAVDWRIFGPSQPDTKRHLPGTLLIKNGQVFWRVAGTVFTIDTSVGQIIARK